MKHGGEAGPCFGPIGRDKITSDKSGFWHKADITAVHTNVRFSFAVPMRKSRSVVTKFNGLGPFEKVC